MMEAFNYLAVLISIILGLGITQLLTGFGRWVEHRAAFKPFAPAIIWAGILLLIHVQTWWSMFGLRLLPAWTFLDFAAVLLQPIILYLLAILVLPGQNAVTAELRANYFGQRQWFFGLLLLLLIVSVMKDLLVTGSLPDGMNLGFHLAFAAAAIVALAATRDIYHWMVAIFSALAMCVYVGLLFAELQ
jgi:hypothetical protein